MLIGTALPTVVVLYARNLGATGSLWLSVAAIALSGFVAGTTFTARAGPWALLLGAFPLLVSPGFTSSLPAIVLLGGALWGSVITLRRKGLIATKPGSRPKAVVRVVTLWAVLVILFFVFYSLFSRQNAQRRSTDRTTTSP